MIRNQLSAQQHYELGVAARKRDDKAGAQEHLLAAAQQAPDVARYGGSLGTFLLQQGKADQALPYLQRAAQQAPEHSGYRNNLSTCRGLCKPSAAPPPPSALTLQAALRESAVGICERGNAALSAGQLLEATNLFERASLNDPECARYAYKLAAVLTRQERAKAALPHFERAAQLEPNNAIFQHGLGTCLYGQAQAGRARWHFERALQLQPDKTHYRQDARLVTVPAMPPRGHTPAQAARQGSAADTADIADLRARIAEDPCNAELYSQLGQLLMNAGRLAEALTALQEARRLAPGVAQHTQQVAQCLMRMQQPASSFAEAERLCTADRPWAAEPYYLAAVQGETGYPSWFNALSTALTCLGRYRESAEMAHRAYDLSADAIYAYNLSVCYHNMGRMAECEKWTRLANGYVPKNLVRHTNDTPQASHFSRGPWAPPQTPQAPPAAAARAQPRAAPQLPAAAAFPLLR